MPLLPFHPFASFFDEALHDSLFFSGNRNNTQYLSSSSNHHNNDKNKNAAFCLDQPLGVRLQHQSDKAFVYVIDAPGIQPGKWRLNLEKKKQETIIRLSVGQQPIKDPQHQKTTNPAVRGDSFQWVPTWTLRE